jgi:hypothetical protein
VGFVPIVPIAIGIGIAQDGFEVGSGRFALRQAQGEWEVGFTHSPLAGRGVKNENLLTHLNLYNYLKMI